MHVLLGIRMMTCMAFSIVYVALHSDSKPIPMVLLHVAICLAGIVGSCGSFIFAHFRKRTSVLLRTINEINVVFLNRKDNALENRRASNRIFMDIFILCSVFQLSAIMTYALFTWEFVKSGVPNFNSFFYQPTPYSCMAFLDEILFMVAGAWTISLVSFYLSMYIEFILRISLHIRVLAGDMRQLRKEVDFNEEEELKKLKFLVKNLNFYYW